MENYLPVIQIPAIPIIRFLQGEENQCHLMGQMHNINSKCNLKKTDLFSNKWN